MASRAIRQLSLLFAAGLAGIGICTSALAQAEDYPSRPVQIIVPYAAGGAADIVIRIVADQLGKRLGQPFVIENKVGAGGALGSELLAHSRPDGYTLGLGSAGNMGIQVTLRSDLPYDPMVDFTPIVMVAAVPNVMVTSKDLDVANAVEFVELSKSRPGELNYGSLGAGTSQHLSAELFKMTTGADITHVPYADPGMAASDLTNGNIHVMFENLTNVLGQIQAGNFRALGISTKERWPELPDVPTMAEQGLAKFDVANWIGVFAPAGLPEPIVSKLNTEINAIVSTPEVRERLISAGVEPRGGTPKELGAFVESQIAAYRAVIEAVGLAAK